MTHDPSTAIATSPTSKLATEQGPGAWPLVALVLAVVGSAGSLALSLGLGLKPCPLCYYQRTLMFAILAVLLVGLVSDRTRGGYAALLCVPLVSAGLALALFHVWLVAAGKLECPLGFFGLGTAPAQSLAAFVLLAVALLGATRAWPRSVALGLVLGLPLAYACIASVPPPKLPEKPYAEPLEICRPPFRGAAS